MNIFTTPSILVTPETLSLKFGMNYRQLSSLIYPNTDNSYRTFLIPKKSGSERIIHTPKKSLKQIQKIIAEELSAAYNPKNSCHGFLNDRSIVTNASRHVGKKFVFNIDLQDFFGSIHFGRVKNLFLKSPFNYSHSIATILAQICCHKGCLPQGAPTSPIITNYICWKLDAQLQALASKYNCSYSRYADDITFSFTTSKNKIPRAIVSYDAIGAVIAGDVIERIIQENGFDINVEKTRLQGKNERQVVTGLTVNKLTNARRSFIRKTNSMLYAWERFGPINAEKHYIDQYLEKPLLARNQLTINKNNGEFFIDVVKGRINFLQMVRGRGDKVYRKFAYRLSKVLGHENKEFLKSAEELLSKSVFIVHNNLDDSQGTSFMLNNVGIVTNEHVVEDVSLDNDVLIEFFREDEITNKRSATHVFSKKSKDLAVFYGSENFSDIPALKIGDSKKLRIGDTVTVVGYPDYSEGESIHVNKGKIIQSAKRFGIDFWLLDIPIIYGISGGPILNDKLEVIGIATRGSKVNDQSTKFNGFIPISNLVDEVRLAEFKNKLDYSKLIAVNPEIEKDEDIFFVGNVAYCKKCFIENKQISIASHTKDKGCFNCKYCANIYIHKSLQKMHAL